MDNQQLTQAEIGWLAGIIDGEGWVGFTIALDFRGHHRRKAVVKTEIRIVNTDPAIIDRVVEIYKKMGINPYIKNRPERNRSKAVYEACLKSMTSVDKILKATISNLTGNKQERATLMIRFIVGRLGDKGMLPSPIYGNEWTGGGKGPKNLVRPYTDEEIEIVKTCRRLQAKGNSETKRGMRDKQAEEFEVLNREYEKSLCS